MIQSSICEIKELAQSASREELQLLKSSLAGDSRKGVIAALNNAQKRLDAIDAESARINQLYFFEESQITHQTNGDPIIIGCDEVGRGPLAGPLCVCAIALNRKHKIQGLNDSKKLSENSREQIFKDITAGALAYHVEFIDAQAIDSIGISSALKQAFRESISKVEQQIDTPDVVLIDGNPLKIHPLEVNVIKGDSKCATIAAASIVAKVTRDNYMLELSKSFPEYGFETNKGYGTEFHRIAIHKFGLTKHHRKSFCGEFLQDSLF